MIRLPSRFRRLDAILADLPVDDPMLLSELDGYLTGVALAPEPMQPAHWLPPIWGGAYGEAPPFEHPVDVRLFGDMVRARLEEIERDLARGKAQPIFDVEERDGEVLWEPWVGGFELAMGLCPESWSQMAEGGDADVAAAIERMLMLVDVAFDRSALMGDDINAICDVAPDAILAIVSMLHARRPRTTALPASNASSAKVGRNDPCACGSGKKHKRCCGLG